MRPSKSSFWPGWGESGCGGLIQAKMSGGFQYSFYTPCTPGGVPRTNKSSKSKPWASNVAFLIFCEVFERCFFLLLVFGSATVLPQITNVIDFGRQFNFAGFVWSGVGARGGVPGRRKRRGY